MSYFDHNAARAGMPAKQAPKATYKAIRSERAANQALAAMVRK
jgi:hypothetical protein